MSEITTSTPHPIAKELPKPLFSYLNSGAMCLLMTVGEDGYPTDAFTWAAATDNKTVRFGVDVGSKTQANLNRDNRAAVQVIGPNNVVFLVKGEVRKIRERIEAAMPLEIEMWEMDVMGARDQSWPGAAPLPFAVQWSGEERRRMIKMEQAVIDEMLG
ncbi:MAG: hypothetical protein Kow006_13380 [Gammaproteobacteria bacterium]